MSVIPAESVAPPVFYARVEQNWVPREPKRISETKDESGLNSPETRNIRRSQSGLAIRALSLAKILDSSWISPKTGRSQTRICVCGQIWGPHNPRYLGDFATNTTATTKLGFTYPLICGRIVLYVLNIAD